MMHKIELRLTKKPISVTILSTFEYLKEMIMRYTIERLISADQEIITYYSKALKLWETILEAKPDYKKLSKSLPSDQLLFEQHCGGRWIGQEIMVITGITQFYKTEDGFGERKESAMLVYKAISSSYCSMEVKSVTEQVAKYYFLTEV
ncbi:hypothetical protein M0H77_RS19605 [Providencia rettgeri]|nr:hypothetical protein [Providencia rettgeri]ELR5263550.1 hypothetical protein [Providencia rettgeri]